MFPPKEVWQVWMWDNLAYKVVHADDPLVTRPYIWLSPSLKETISGGKHCHHMFTLKVAKQHDDSRTQEKTMLEECYQDVVHASDGWNDDMAMCKREALEAEGERKCPRKKMKMEVMINSSEWRNRGKGQAGPSMSAGVKRKAKKDVPVTSKDQDAHHKDCKLGAPDHMAEEESEMKVYLSYVKKALCFFLSTVGGSSGPSSSDSQIAFLDASGLGTTCRTTELVQ
ncbi:hypothetical protein L210DRAFT_3509845 [Boletus edulis BED1]|uniref:Uncharacterized protein n=1 Tax=Boletus edulis BED1 TaxID=1328754 RepID=A0AAD4BER5_BOLED|nr:hypothetical protein L210DRAFT_3509845 [Boletus edulis BED1]